MNNNKKTSMGFAETMYFWKYVKKLAIKSFIVYYQYDAKGNHDSIELTPDEFLQYCHGYFEYLSKKNKWYREKVLGLEFYKDKKHLRLAFKAMELKNLKIARLGGYEPELRTAAECKKALEVVKPYRNQDNRGYMSEYLELGDNWDPNKRGIDIDDGRIEIKYMNGQIEV